MMNFCVDCVYYKNMKAHTREDEKHLCEYTDHYKVRYNIVTGERYPIPKSAGFCVDVRNDENRCGVESKWFTKKTGGLKHV